MIGIYKILVFVITTTFYIVGIICSLINVGFKTVNKSTIVTTRSNPLVLTSINTLSAIWLLDDTP